MSDFTDDVAWSDRDELLTYKPKRGVTHMKTITVEASTKEARSYNGETTYGVKVGGSWMDLHVTQRPEKGQSFDVNIENIESKGKTYIHARPVGPQIPKAPQPSPAPLFPQLSKVPAGPIYTFTGSGARATPYSQGFAAWEAVAIRAHAIAKDLEPGESDARARLAFVTSLLIAFGEGKLVIDDVTDEEWGEALAARAAKPAETNEAHLHLQKTIWEYCEKTGKVAGHDIVVLRQVSGHGDWFSMTEKEAIAARLAVEKMIDDATDYKTDLTNEVKKYFASNGWNFADATPENVARKQTILRSLGITGPFKDATNREAKVALEHLKDPSFLPF